MRILTLALQVPDSRANIKVASDGLGIDKAGVKLVCNPFDEFAVEQAVQFKEKRSDVEEIVVLTIGTSSAAEALRTALAMGADSGIHICDENASTKDELQLAQIIACAINRKEQKFDLILCGKQAIDRDAGELGPALAEYLGLHHVGAVVELELAEDGKSLRAHRRIEGAQEIVQASLPILITCDKGLVEPRYPALANLIKAKKKPLETIAVTELDGVGEQEARTKLVSLSEPPAREQCRIIEGEPEEMAKELVRLLHEEAKVL